MAFGFKQTMFVLYVIIVLAFTVSSLHHHEECLALSQFKQTVTRDQANASFDIGGYHKLDSWRKIPSNLTDHDDSRSDCCFWDGVVCSNKDHVIGLDLSQSSIRGPIKSNSTLFNLVHLQMLNLSMNDFVGSQIPSEIARLKQLRILNLYGSGFSGQIPSEMSQLVQLTKLNLSWNPLKLRSPGLEYLLQNMTRIEALDLSGVDISSSVPRFLANFSSMRFINLQDCQLQDEFPSAIFQLPKLNFLSLCHNIKLVGFLSNFHNNSLLEHLDMYETGFGGTIPESVGKLNHLSQLSLGNCSFSGHIPGSLSNLTQLTYLDLYYNKLTGVVPSLESLSKLITLYLDRNNFEKGRMLDWISKLTKLRHLDVDDTNIHEEIPPSIANLTKLSYLSMGENFIFGQIPSLFMNLTTLTFLNLKMNKLEGPISSAFSNFSGLEYLSLYGNKFNGTISLDTFVGLNKLYLLDLGMNRISVVDTSNYTNNTLPELYWLGLSSCNLKEFPAFLRIRMKMVVLNLHDNRIEGLVPKWVWNNSQETLQILNLSNNFITGFDQQPDFLPWFHLNVFQFRNNQLQGRLPIPPKTTLVYDVSNNNLTGEIPPLICEVKYIQVLDLSSNNMIGTLSPCLDNLSNSLSVLNLKRNNFHGPMMNNFTHGSPLKRIDLSENQFAGQLSKSLAKCTNLEVLAIGDNSYDGPFPFWLGNLTKLQVLILRSNKFYGEIQGLTTISSQFPKLRILDLANNNFSGQLPGKSFRNWNAMESVNLSNPSALGFEISFDMTEPIEYRYSMTLTNKGVKREYEKILNIFVAIDLSCNNFVGEIPRSFQYLQGLESLNLSNNHLTGRILPSLGNLKNLESLDLSQNELAGEIPRELLQLGYLAMLNVSFNHLIGRIPQGKQFNTFENNSYVGNLGLCGTPLSNDCESSKVVTPASTSDQNESVLPSERIDWIIILLGVGSGLIVGIVIGNILYARYSDWFDERFGLRNDKWVRPLRNKRRN